MRSNCKLRLTKILMNIASSTDRVSREKERRENVLTDDLALVWFSYFVSETRRWFSETFSRDASVLLGVLHPTRVNPVPCRFASFLRRQTPRDADQSERDDHWKKSSKRKWARRKSWSKSIYRFHRLSENTDVWKKKQSFTSESIAFDSIYSSTLRDIDSANWSSD